MDNDVKTKNNEEIAHFLNANDRMIKGIDALCKKNRPLLNRHRYLTDDELSRLCRRMSPLFGGSKETTVFLIVLSHFHHY